MTIAAFTSICEEDAIQFGEQYLAEISRLQIPFYMHFDKCLPETKENFKKHPLCGGFTENNTENVFSEMDKQGIFNLVVADGHDWALGWDVDETWCDEAPDIFAKLNEKADWDLLRYHWANLWNNDDDVRIDGSFWRGSRVNIYNLKDRKWEYYHPTINGARLMGRHPQDFSVGDIKLVCWHHGLKTAEMRKRHSDRWDKIYSSHVGSNPYGFWKYALDEATYPPITIHKECYLKIWTKI